MRFEALSKLSHLQYLSTVQKRLTIDFNPAFVKKVRRKSMLRHFPGVSLAQTC